ncbi:hypothetical protein [Chryseobacterium sp. SL1]|uniref:hypothetical protein n=1 Tax=Chryseobacterium sp. SL1 TaxID=2995159 RepID=UPI0022758E2B|nr:hypothetical protein [Chryseobacterium sp. SL1]MCY1661256.1 hypothetical protein [Chryseobacterium sp. SL1]
MKKKLIIGALALTSILAFAQKKGGSSSSETDRKFFGSEITGWGQCHYTGVIQADGTPETVMEVEITTYVFWIGFSHTEPRYNVCTP